MIERPPESKFSTRIPANSMRQRENQRQLKCAAAALLFAALVLAYYPALRGGFLWDDDTYITLNRTLRMAGGLWAIWLDPSATCQYYPLSFTLFWTIHRFFGFNPLAFHLATLLLHGTAAILFWQVLERLRVKGALLAAVIFALHPVNVMSVAWMTELKNTLSCSLALGSAWAYVRYSGLGVYKQEVNGARTRWRWYGVSLALFLLAMLAKTAVSFLPASLLLVVWWQRDRVTRQDWLSLLPMLGISVGMGAFTIYIERHAGGASGADFTIGFPERVLISGRSFWFYLGKLVWPARLIFIYPRWNVDAGAWWQWLYPAGTAAVLTGAWMARKHIGKGPFAALMHFYISTSLLVLGVILYMMRYSFVADHWAYFGSLGVIALIGSGLTRAIDGLGRRWGNPLKLAAGTALTLALGSLTWAQSRSYSNMETLWRTTIAEAPQCWMAHTNLGFELYRQGRIEEAVAEYSRALEINAADPEAHNDLGLALQRQGNLERAIAEHREAIWIEPEFPEAFNGLGVSLLDEGKTREAEAAFREALRINPADAEAANNLGNVLAREGRIDEAINEYQEAARANPDYAGARNGLGSVLIREGRIEDAIAQYGEALRIDPGYAAAHANLADALVREGRNAEAIAQYGDALRINPALPEARNSLGILLDQVGQTDEAATEYREALSVRPDFAEAHYNLGNALLQEGQVQQAVAEFREAARLNPAQVETHVSLGAALLEQGQAGEALGQLQKAYELEPANLSIENRLAWLLATAAQPSLRDGVRAVQLASQASQSAGGDNPAIFRTLAAAYAQAGQYPSAVEAAQKALDLAQTASDTALAEALRREIKLYQAGQPYVGP
jgi:tetratricopeptide (TPR) repeat protein